MNPGTCAWCRGPMRGKRPHARTCSKRCRQALSRFSVPCEPRRAADVPMRFAYADPPYPGLARRYYSERPDFGGEVDHAALLSRLQGFDAFALSTSMEALAHVLALCVERDLDVRTAVWSRGARAQTRTRRPRNAWEPVIYWSGRDGRRDLDVWPDDVLTYGSHGRSSEPEQVTGMKPARFAFWMFDLVGARAGDEFHDLFPGSRGITRAWEILNRRSVRTPNRRPLQVPNRRESPAREVSGAAAAKLSGRAAREPSRTTSPKPSHLEVIETVAYAGSANRRESLEGNRRASGAR